MKLNKRILAIPAIIAFAISACTEDPMVTLNPNSSVDVEVSSTQVVLTEESAGNDALTVSYPQPDFGFNANTTYFIYLDEEGGDFSTAISVNNGNNLSKTFKGQELNKHLINLGFEPGEPMDLIIKVVAQLTEDQKFESAPVTVTATAYSSFLDLSTPWGVVGSGYNNWGAFPDAPFFTTSTPNVIVAYVTLLNGEIKFRQNNDWTVNLGDDGGDGTLNGGGANIAVTAGPKKITFNTADNTYTIEPFTWGIVGSAYNNWGGDGPDFPFTYDDATDQWRAVVKLKDGEFKIRKNNDWGTNYGDDGADGTLEPGGANMVITAGNYIVTFSEKDLTVTIEQIPIIWGLVGNAYNNWGATPDASFVPDWRNEGVWVLKNVTLTDGEFKFRANNDWGTNYGDDGGNKTLEAAGANIPATAGIYTITLDFSDAANPTWDFIKY
jgi:starch-binding outer membrane protein SusE/F